MVATQYCSLVTTGISLFFIPAWLFTIEARGRSPPSKATDSKRKKRINSIGPMTDRPGTESESELSSAGWRADLYSSFGDQRNPGYLRHEKPTRVFSSTGLSHDVAGDAAKCAVLGLEASYFSDIDDLLAERGRFELPIPVKVWPLSRRLVSTTHAPLRARLPLAGVARPI